jgi:hypothetical protein
MGYRSDVGLVLVRDDETKSPTIPELLVMAKLKDIDPIKEWGDDGDFNLDDNKLVFQAEGVKWYSDFPAVQAIATLMDFISETEGFSYGFVRIGEEVNDIETNYVGEKPPYDLITVSRQINIDE